MANVLSCMALFVALSGVAYAAVKIPANAVKAQNIAKEAVTAPKLKKNAVISAKLATNSVINAKIANGAITSGKLANGSVRSGQLGGGVVTEAKLKNEAIGNSKLGAGAVTSSKVSPTLLAQLLKNVTYVTETSVNDSETSKSVTATCPTNKQAIGGGVRINSPATVNVVPSESAPVTSATNVRVGWIAGGREFAAEAGNWQVVAYAVCAEL
ncbi:MAG TPA: hypothetical protein VFI03_09705 [Solirubrobacterales bacterium]|nr:hypothetical protein [Solirubrobacterales bacterium]